LNRETDKLRPALAFTEQAIHFLECPS
jgi:hypothetical protein